MDLNNISTLFLDFDGTLVDSNISEIGALKEICSHFDIPIEKQENLIKIYVKENRRLWQKFEKKEIEIPEIIESRFRFLIDRYPEMKDSNPEEINTLYLKYFVSKTEIDELTFELLSKLREKFNLMIVSNGINRVQIERINLIGINSLVDGIVTSEEVGNIPKPNTMMFERALSKLVESKNKLIDKDEIIMIGDSYSADILGAENWGIRSVHISNEEKKNSYKHFNLFAEELLRVYDEK